MSETPPPSNQNIPAKNRQQAMDWSLVLASQGIEHLIESEGETSWTLVVTEADHEAALNVIRQYRLENRHWRWRRPIFQPDLFFDWSSIMWVLLTVVVYGWSGSGTDLRGLGQMDGAALLHGEWWRLFTATLLHADLAHLATNGVFGFVFLGLALGRYGPGVGLLAAYLAGVGGNVVAWLFFGATQRSLGASGVVMGALGLVTIQSWTLLKQRNPRALRLFIGGIMGGVLLFIFLGLSPGSDVMAHLGGFITGMLLGSLLALRPRLTHEPWVNFAAAILFGVLVVLPWLRALSRVD